MGNTQSFEYSSTSAEVVLAGRRWAVISANYNSRQTKGKVREAGTAEIVGNTRGQNEPAASVKMKRKTFDDFAAALKTSPRATPGAGLHEIFFDVQASIFEPGAPTRMDEILGCTIANITTGFDAGSTDALTVELELEPTRIKIGGNDTVGVVSVAGV